MAELGSYIDNPQINNEACRVAAEFFGDCLRTKAGLTRQSETTNPEMIQLYQSAKQGNQFSESNIKKFQDRLMVLLIRNYPYERRIKKFYKLPSIIEEAADFDDFTLTRDHLPNFFQIFIHGYHIQLLPFHDCPELKYNLVYDNLSQTWI